MNFSVEEATAFLTQEARILDEWRLKEWVALFSDEGKYLVPSMDNPDMTHEEGLYLICDDRHRLQQRAERLLKPGAHAEYPHSVTTRIISNVEVEDGDEGKCRVVCSFVVYRARGESFKVYPGRSYYDLDLSSGTPKIVCKKAVLGLTALRPQGLLSIIL